MASAGAVIVGAGQSGCQVAISLRDYGYADPIRLVGDEAEYPYQRPPLSKAYLLGDTTPERLLLRPKDYYTKNSVDVLTKTRVTTIDRNARRITLSNGNTLAYDHLVLATGARNRKLPVSGEDISGVVYLLCVPKT